MPYIVSARDGNAMLYAGPNGSITLDRARAVRYGERDAAAKRREELAAEASGDSEWRIQEVA